MFKDRLISLYFILFFVGALLLIYQASGLTVLGDSINFLCLAYLVSGFFASCLRHIFENSLLVTLGYMLPLFLRNLMKEDFQKFQKIPSGDFFLSAITTFLMTFIFGLLFVSAGYILIFLFKKLRSTLKGRTTLRSSTRK